MSTLAAKIDVTKIEKERLFPGKNGAKYLDVILIETPDNKYGHDFMICQSVSKEERQAGKRGAILGNAKFLGGRDRDGVDQTRSEPRRTPPGTNPAKTQDSDESVPF